MSVTETIRNGVPAWTRLLVREPRWLNKIRRVEFLKIGPCPARLGATDAFSTSLSHLVVYLPIQSWKQLPNPRTGAVATGPGNQHTHLKYLHNMHRTSFTQKTNGDRYCCISRIPGKCIPILKAEFDNLMSTARNEPVSWINIQIPDICYQHSTVKYDL